ncbi:MAG: hypothetical protein INF74_12945 [Roseomonas sp.]|nr:hypothetical protein [Roseomonas sp.]
MKPISWNPHASITLSVFEANGDLWFTARALSALFGVTVQNIQIHLRDWHDSGQSILEVTFPAKQKEGSRFVIRQLKHYPLEIAHAIAVRSQRFRELDWLLSFAAEYGIRRTAYRIAPIKERAFGSLLQGVLDGLVSVIPQYHAPPHFIDFFIPAWRLAIEYDERHHHSPKQAQADAARQAEIELSLDAKFIRVPVGKEIEALNQIVKFGVEAIISNRLNSEVGRVNPTSDDMTSKRPGTIEWE